MSSIEVSKRGYTHLKIDFDEKHAAPTFVEIHLKRVEGGGIYGRLIDDAGNPVKRFCVEFFDSSRESRRPQFAEEFENDGGMFSTTVVPPGTYDVSIVSLPYSQMERQQGVTIARVDIRNGYFYGEILAQFPPHHEKK